MAIIAEDVETALKVIVVGNGGVGKSSMIARFCRGVFTENYKKTIGVDFLERDHFVQQLGESVRMMVWDTAGQEEFDTLTRQYYRGAGACVFVFSTTDRASFDALPSWKAKVMAECGDGIQMALVQNKVDLIDRATMTPAEAEEMARKLGLRFYRACVKENTMITDVFDYLAASFVNQLRERQAARPAVTTKSQIAATLSGAGPPGNSPHAASGAHATGPAGNGGCAAAPGPSQPFRIDRGVIRRTGGKKHMKCAVA
mmetsp:Transcript_15836/g.48395  ORF Transcript_15836/g.48395 Transcript_15836/m.48395 type:complete len:257 (-) Transcript_15836:425-1195(-)